MFYSQYLAQKEKIKKTVNCRNDGAPMLYYIDIFKNVNFPQPILPIPSRIDKIIVGKMSGIIPIKQSPTLIIQDIEYRFNLILIYKKCIQNLLNYTHNYHRKISFRSLSSQKIKKWWTKIQNYIPQITSYEEDASFLFDAYLSAFQKKQEGISQELALLQYCDDVITYINIRLKDNQITVWNKGMKEDNQLYTEKKGFLYPTICEYDCIHIESQKKIQKAMVPVMIYDDLLECFLFNKQILQIKLNPEITLEELSLSSADDLSYLKEQANSLEIISFDSMLKSNIIYDIKKFDPTSVNTEILFDQILDWYQNSI